MCIVPSTIHDKYPIRTYTGGHTVTVPKMYLLYFLFVLLFILFSPIHWDVTTDGDHNVIV